MIRIAVADDQALMREGLRLILDQEEDMEVVATAADGTEAYAAVVRHRPDIVLLDIQKSESDGIACTRRIKGSYPDTIVLLLTSFADDDYIVEGFLNGANGFLMKNMTGDRFIAAVRDAANGDLLLPAVAAAKLAARLSVRPSIVNARDLANSWRSRGIALSGREKEIALLLVQGCSNRQIASALNFSVGTVKNYVSAIYGKIGIHDRPNAILYLQGADLTAAASEQPQSRFDR